MERPSWTRYFLGIAEAVSNRGDCTRRQVGAVIVDSDHRIISTGYNGTLPGKKGCLKGACPRGRHYKGVSVASVCGGCGRAWPCPEAVKPGSSYDTGPGACIALHAEQNALLYAFRSVKGATMYLTDAPCDGCMKLIRGAQIQRVVTPSSEWIWHLPWFHDHYFRAASRADWPDVSSWRCRQAHSARPVA